MSLRLKIGSCGIKAVNCVPLLSRTSRPQTVGNHDAVQLRAQIVPALVQHAPVISIVRTFEDHRPDLNARERVGACVKCCLQCFGPVAPDPVDASDLLFDYAGVPLRVQQDHDPASLMEV
ncbi:hypothetical protein ASF49_12710 [Methylobacterium sp. Leaf104]|nr:hypothetical protein ASF49_12710 [Methylobacterium sp. Leaf104]